MVVNEEIKETLTLPESILIEMILNVRSVYPEEGCGLLGGQDGVVFRHFPTQNIEPENKQIRYLIDPHQQLKAEEALDRENLELLAIYHSHPKTEARPSPTDVRTAYYPEAFYILISLADFDEVEVRAYKIVKPDPWGETGEIVEQNLEII